MNYIKLWATGVTRTAFAIAASVLMCKEAVAHNRGPRNVTVELRPGIFSDVSLDTYRSSDRHCRGVSAFAVHGLAHTGKTFAPLAEHLLGASSPSTEKICKLYAINLPAHGTSSLPYPAEKMMAGELSLEDYTTALLAVLKHHHGKKPTLLIGHSMGGLVVMMAQERLLSGKSSLARLGVKNTLLLAPSIPSPMPWAFVDSGAFAGLASQFVTQDPVLGLIAYIPSNIWVGMFFMNQSGQFVPGTPTPAEAESRGYISFEPLVAASELAALAGPRPFVRSGAFNRHNGTQLAYIAYEQDSFTLFPDENKALYEHLTEDAKDRGFFARRGSTTVHDSFLADPAHVDAAMQYLLHGDTDHK